MVFRSSLFFGRFMAYAQTMESTQHKLLALQRDLGGLRLEAKEGSFELDKVLAGKVLATRVFQRFTLAEIVTKI